MPHSDPNVPLEDKHFDVTAATALRDGGFVRVWYGAGGEGTRLYGQVFDPLLRLYKDTFVISVEDSLLDTDPEVVALSDGGFFVSWSAEGALYGARYDWLGEIETDAFLITENGHSAAVTELADGDLAIIWAASEKGLPFTDVLGAIYDTDGSRVKTISNITGETDDWQREPVVTALDNGGFVVAWETDRDTASFATIDYDVQFRIFDANGNAVGGPVTASSFTNGDQVNPELATLENGNFVIVWGSESSGSSLENIYGRIYSPTGTAVTSQLSLDPAPDAGYDQVFPAVAALDDGGFYVSWGAHNNRLLGQRFDENGAAVGNSSVIESLSSEQHYNADVTTSSDGRVFVSWQYYTQDNSAFNMDATVLTLAPVVPSIDGTNGADNISGTGSADLVNALGGNDTLKGLAGNDTLYGGDGDDFISTGDGDDLVAAGAGNDEVFAGGNGEDIIRGDAGNDVLGGGSEADLLFGGGTSALFDTDTSGQDGQDTLYGGAGNDILVGGDWTDTDNDGFPDVAEIVSPTGSDANLLWAGDGDDVAIGALGRDTIGGGEGNDFLIGLDGNDVLYGGKGSDAVSRDTLLGGAGNDQLFAGSGADDLYGENGNDVLYGGSSSDSLSGGGGSDTLWGGDGDDLLTGGGSADTLNGGTGNDTLYGGAGEDRFAFGSNHGNDIISDFDVAEDLLALSNLGFQSADDLTAVASNATIGGETGLLLETGAGSSIFLAGLDTDSLASITVSF